MAETVQSIDIGVVWNDGVPEAVIITAGRHSALALNAEEDDEDQRAVVLCWSGVRHQTIGGPNDEAISGHRLWKHGLENVLWIGEVNNSKLIAGLEKQNRVHTYHSKDLFTGLVHYIVRTKEDTVEVVATSLEVKRIAGSTFEAAPLAFAD